MQHEGGPCKWSEVPSYGGSEMHCLWECSTPDLETIFLYFPFARQNYHSDKMVISYATHPSAHILQFTIEQVLVETIFRVQNTMVHMEGKVF